MKDNKKYFLPRGEIQNYKEFDDLRDFYDQPDNDLIKQYNEVRKVSIGPDDDYTTNFLLDYAQFKDNQKLIAVDSSKQKTLDADPREQFNKQHFQKMLEDMATKQSVYIYTILEQSKEAILEFYKGTAKVL